MAVAGPFIVLMVALAPPLSPVPIPDEPPGVSKSAEQVRKDFVALLDRPRVPLDVRAEETKPEKDRSLVSERLSFATEKKADGTVERVPTLVVKSVSIPEGKRPAVIVLHGTGGNKDGVKSWLDQLARKGFVAVAIDARYHGDRVAGVKGASAYVEAITKAWRARPNEPQEHPFYYDTCWDLWRTLDYLETRPDVDTKRIAMVGFSMGGIETWLAAATDGRVAVAIPAIGVQSFRWSLEHEAWQGRANTIKASHEAAAKDLGEPAVNAEVCKALWGKVIPGILDDFDCPSMIRLFAPRPLLILNGDRDPNCPVGGARVAIDAAKASYRAAGAADRLKVDVAEGVGHAVTDEQRSEAVAWLERWLKP